MTYLVTARKWRPMVFDDIIGQSHIATTLRNAIATNRLSHAYIFSGPRGVGKTTTARILAKTINCLHPKEFNPDNECELCKEITEGRSVNVFEIDGASNRGVDEIRNLREAVRYAPARGKYKVYIIDEVHMLTKEAFNALLKTLEEPPPNIVFIFATTEIHKVPLTILSRCQRFDFRRISVEEIIDRLRYIAGKEKISIDNGSLMIIAKRGDGSMRDAQSIFDQIVSFCGDNISAKQILTMLNMIDEELFFRTTSIIKSKDIKNGLLLIDEIVSGGFDLKDFLTGLTEHLRNMLVTLSTGSSKLIETSEVYKKRYQDEVSGFTETDILRLIKIAGETEAALRWNQQQRLKLEIGLMRMIKLDSSVEITQLLQQIDELKKNAGNNSARTSEPSAMFGNTRPASSETPVRGSVKATQPTLRPDQIVSPMVSGSPAPFTFSKRTISAQLIKEESVVAQSTKTEASGVALTSDEATKKWSTFLEETLKQRIAVGTMLGETNLIDVRNNMLRIGCPDDFHLDGLRRNRQFLQEIAERVYGAKVQLEAIVARQAEITPGISSMVSRETSSQLPKIELNIDPRSQTVVQALIREFGAKEIE